MLTLDQLKRRGRALANRCFFCSVEEETTYHILVHCPIAKILWDFVLALVRVKWVFPLTMRETLLSWHVAFVCRKRKKAWKAIPFAFFGQFGGLERG